jgi:four helix bundle suffix protein
MSNGFIPKHGAYQNLLTYQKASIIYDATVFFCERYVSRRSRTVDQMVQAARSGKQNIVEASMASATSKEMEIKLINVARASLEELLEDYRDFLRTRSHEIWNKNSKAAMAVRRLAGRKPEDGTIETGGTAGTSGTGKAGGHLSLSPHSSHPSKSSHESYETYRPHIESRSPETVADILICLINQTTYLLRRQLTALEQAFLREGGLRERMTRARLLERGKRS